MAPRSSRTATSTISRSRSISKSRPTTTTRPRTSKSRPRTAATSTIAENEILCAVSEGRGMSPTVGLAFVNLSTSEAVLCQFADTQTYARTCHKIRVFDPSEIIIADTVEDTKLVAILAENVERMRDQQSQPTPVHRRYWNEAYGRDYLEQLAFPEDLVALKLSLVGKYYAVCCFSAVLRYMDLGLGTMFAPHSLQIKFESSEGAMMIDTSTIASLELVQNLQNVKSKDCLFGVVNQTLTKMGARMLKSNILQPSTDKVKIEKRYEAVQELSTKEAIFFAVREALEGHVDTDKALAGFVLIQQRANFSFMESSVNNVIMLKTFVDAIMPIYQALAGAESEELKDIRELCKFEHYFEIQQLIEYALNEHVRFSNQSEDMRNQRVYAIKAGVNGFLDVARRAYKEIQEDIEQMTDTLKAQHEIGINLKFDPARQFFFRIKAVELENGQLPEPFINVFRRKDWIECQTLDLVKMNQRLKDAHAEVVSLSDSSIQKLIDAVRSKIHPLFKISESIALLDMLAAFAHLVTTQDYVKPEFIDSTLAVKACRHPIRERMKQDKFIPNDVFATPSTRFQIITGCNMSGKSTYIRSIALVTVIAQIGCFVPAEYAAFQPAHQLFARISTDDSIEANVSTFSAEMREMAFILRTMEPRSLVIVDELGRGTSTTDGLAIAIAISEALIESKAYVWFVTHFRDLPRILAERAGVVNLHLEVDIAPDFSRMKMMYKIGPGNEEQKFYGLAISRLMDLPPQVHEYAAKMSQHLHERNEARKSNAKTLAVARRRKLVLNLKEKLDQVQESELDVEELRQYLIKLQREFIVRMSAIDTEVAAASVEPEPSTIREHETDVSDNMAMSASRHGSHVDDPIEVSTHCSSPASTRDSDVPMNDVHTSGVFRSTASETGIGHWR